MERKMIVIGCPGAGKSTFARGLAEKTGIDLYHLDAIYWRKDCSHISRAKLIAEQKKILKKDSFIIDGNYKSTLEMRIEKADLVFLFDLPVEVCIYGATHRRGKRPEMPCELPDGDELVEFIKSFNAEVKPIIDDLLERYNSKVIVFHSHEEADDYLRGIKNDLTIKTNEGLFNHRVASVIVSNGKLLAQKNIKDNTYYLVGGRVAFGESTEDALVREVREELGVNITSYRPLWVNECFFIDGGKKFHEIGVYYLVDISNTGFDRFEKHFETEEGHRTNTYEWLDIRSLEQVELYPLFIKDEIKSLDDGLKLIITKEAELNNWR